MGGESHRWRGAFVFLSSKPAKGWRDMFEIILYVAAALILIFVFLFILGVVLHILGFASPYILDWIFERDEKASRKEVERIINDGGFDGWLADRVREPFYKKLKYIRVKKKVVDSVKTLLIALGLMMGVALGGQILMGLIGK
ncbi:hypothetical protein A2115_03525 [Candidatus Woesebacteria bacterium GWA1_41_8]|uniref:Uncharacterized protein n=1 Tax=Candidatus Woesebacteria bacterium GWA1_41_8 TaxID=1802471 RepID=A0A1F7WIJ6_9BACT|nr:MAG: hypothetical protein A2115_03525 [Candidatus Woesebacteria bacterium GWA1_41_8]